MIQSTTAKALVLAMAGSALALGGCGSDGGGGSSSSQQQPAFDGSGSEALGGYVAEVTKSTGIYGADGHYAPAGMTRHLRLYLSGGSLYLNYINDLSCQTYAGDVELAPDSVAKTYGGSTSWTPSEGYLSSQLISEEWVVSFAGDTVTLTVSGEGPTAADVGTVTFVLRPQVAVPATAFTYGRITSHTDARNVGQTCVLEIDPSGTGGARGNLCTDAASQWNTYFLAPLYRAGNDLRGGQHGNTDYQSDENDVFATMSITLDTLGNPSAVSATFQDYNNIDGDTPGQTDVEPATWSATASGFVPFDAYRWASTHLNDYDLTVTSITEGGLLSLAFGPVDHELADFFHDKPGNVLDAVGFGSDVFVGGLISPAKREMVVWDGQYYDYWNDCPSYDFDLLATTEERLTIVVDYDDTVMPATPVGGSITLEVFNQAGSRTSTENMTFTLADPTPAP